MKPCAENPLVSIITPSLNSERFIADNIRSIMAQTYRRIEHIIVDGASTDRTLEIVRELDPAAIVISERDEGISDAFNKGLKLAKGDIVAILNSDDYYAHNEVVQRIVDLFDSRPDISLLYGRVRFIEEQAGETLVIFGQPFSLKKMRKEIITPHPAIFARKKVYEAAGFFSLQYRVAMDHEYFLRATTLFEPYFLAEVITIMRRGGMSTRNIYRAHREIYRTQRAHGVSIISAFSTLIYGYVMTAVSLTLQRVGLKHLVLRYRKWTNQL